MTTENERARAAAIRNSKHGAVGLSANQNGQTRCGVSQTSESLTKWRRYVCVCLFCSKFLPQNLISNFAY